MKENTHLHEYILEMNILHEESSALMNSVRMSSHEKSYFKEFLFSVVNLIISKLILNAGDGIT